MNVIPYFHERERFVRERKNGFLAYTRFRTVFNDLPDYKTSRFVFEVCYITAVKLLIEKDV